MSVSERLLDSLFTAADTWSRRRGERELERERALEHERESGKDRAAGPAFAAGVAESAMPAGVFEPRRYSVTVDARPRERRDGWWVIGETTVRIRFYCSATTHVLSWPDYCKFASRYDAERDAYVAGLRWARARYG